MSSVDKKTFITYNLSYWRAAHRGPLEPKLDPARTFKGQSVYGWNEIGQSLTKVFRR